MLSPRAIGAGVWAWLLGLSAIPLVAVGGLATGVAGGAGYYAYRAYDYVQHDNDFCLTCHLMEDPYDLFARSAHQGLGCKACHRPNVLERGKMGLTAVFEHPEEIRVHAEVPNEACAECHVDGDPDKWRMIANSAGHKVHLESSDSRLRGLQCVECHSSSVHQFTPVDRTCAQSDCHQDSRIRLGGMSGLTIHCAACHAFVAPVTDDGGILGNVVDAAILPDQEECLSCHAMREQVHMPDPDPHRGACAACHDPHTQSVSAQAETSCGGAACHADLELDRHFHSGLGPEVLLECTTCHHPHDFTAQGANCLSCHEEILEH